MSGQAEAAQLLLDLAARHERDLALKSEKLERLQRECDEIRGKIEALRLSARELEASETRPGAPTSDRGKNSASEFRLVLRELLTQNQGEAMHHTKIHEALQVARPDLDEAATRTLVYNVAKKYPDDFDIKRGELSLKRPGKTPQDPLSSIRHHEVETGERGGENDNDL